MSVTILDHSLIKHKLTNIRKTETTTKDFYQNVNEIAGLMAYEITRNFPLKEVKITTPDMSEPGKKEVTAKWGDFEASVEITVVG